MDLNKPKFAKIFNFEDRLVRFAGECIIFSRKLEKHLNMITIKINSLDHQAVLP